MFPKLSRADEILAPERADEFKRKSAERAEKRTRLFKTITRSLLKNDDFCEWFSEMIISFGFWRIPNHELTAYEQGRRAVVHEIVERVLTYGGEEAEKWFAERAKKFAQFIQDERK